MAEATRLYQELGFPALQKGGHDKKLVGYFQGDTGTINQLVHLWKFDDDADRRKHWAGVFANEDFVEGFASKFRPLVMTQEVKLLTAAPWGPHPWLVLFRAKGFCACQGIRRHGVRMCLAVSTPAVLPSVGRKTSAPRTCLTPLNTFFGNQP